jgi:hypothetical protein
MSILIKYMLLIQKHRPVFRLIIFLKCMFLFSSNYVLSHFAENTQWPNINSIKHFNLKIIDNNTELSKELNKINNRLSI